MLLYNIQKDYGNVVKILQYQKPFKIKPPTCQLHLRVNCPDCFVRRTDAPPSLSSLQRTKTIMKDLTLANQFDLFCTFTFNPELVDSFDYDSAKKAMSKWLNNARFLSPDLKYLIVAELHKSGRIHFHALMKNYNGKLTDAKRSLNNRTIYNMQQWKYGFSTAVKIDNIEKVSSYVQKYITKDMLKITNKKRYWASRNLNRPIKTYNVEIDDILPVFITDKYKNDRFAIITSIPYIVPIIREGYVRKRNINHAKDHGYDSHIGSH